MTVDSKFVIQSIDCAEMLNYSGVVCCLSSKEQSHKSTQIKWVDVRFGSSLILHFFPTLIIRIMIIYTFGDKKETSSK